MKMNDEVISHIAKVLQMAIITGTDIVDHLRMIVLEERDGKLSLEEEYLKNVEENIQKMLNETIGGES